MIVCIIVYVKMYLQNEHSVKTEETKTKAYRVAGNFMTSSRPERRNRCCERSGKGCSSNCLARACQMCTRHIVASVCALARRGVQPARVAPVWMGCLASANRSRRSQTGSDPPRRLSAAEPCLHGSSVSPRSRCHNHAASAHRGVDRGFG